HDTTLSCMHLTNFSSTFTSLLRLDGIMSPLNLKVCISKIKVNPYLHKGHFDSNRLEFSCIHLEVPSNTPPGTPIASSYGRKYLTNKQEAWCHVDTVS
ncbi:hypothetical protein JB92DRAFT_2967407, partial [Gautieria morchelliformis]